MKKTFTFLIGIVLSITILNSQVAPPQAFSFKANIKDKYGLPVLFRKINLRMTILQGGMNGPVIYSEYFTPTTDLYSQVDVQIGRGTVLPGYGNFPSIDWSSDEYFLKIEVDSKGGTNYQLLSVTQLLSVPYALYAGAAGNAFSGNYSDLVGAPILSVVATTGNYNNLLDKPTLFSGDYIDLTSKPSFFSGNYEDLFNKPTLFDGTWSSLTGKPSYAQVAFSGIWNDLINKPTTLAGYGITDALSNLHPASVITAIDITSWNTAFNWGNHSGLYRPVSYVPAWSEIIDKPTFATVATSGSYNDLIYTPTIDGSETKVTAGTNVTVTGEGTTTNPYSINSSGVGATIPGNNPGDMQYWNGTSWVIVPVGSDGQVLTLTNGIPTWGSSVWGLIIGDYYEGGKVAYILRPGDPGYDANVRHGLIAAPGDLLGAQWGCYGTVISGADGTAIGTGAQNTTDIVTGCTTANIAAKLCSDLELNGYSDWYLPSKDELNKLYINKAAVGGFKSSILSSGYWSSSESTSDYSYLEAWTQEFVNGSQNLSIKSYQGNVRAVRAF